VGLSILLTPDDVAVVFSGTAVNMQRLHAVQVVPFDVDRVWKAMCCRMNLDGTGAAAADELVAYCVRRLSGPQAGDAWHRLVEAGPEVIPSIVRTLRAGMPPPIQAELVRVLASYRSPDTIAVLSEMVVSGESEVWKAALDALVTVGGDDARKALQQAGHLAGGERRSWIAEAIEQVGGTGRWPRE
jgi:hypothetical protein